MRSEEFYLGVDAHLLERVGVPAMVSHGRLRSRKTLPRASAPWVCDSRGFTELAQHGRWTITAEEYAAALRRYAVEIGMLRWASPQDWMCEPAIINGGVVNGRRFAGTGLSVAEHQERTVASVLELRALVSEVHIIPVIQGWQLSDYLACVALYRRHGIDVRDEPVVGLGSVCRRQSTSEIDLIVSTLAARGIQLHGFGVKTDGLDAYGPLLESADSMAWSYGGRRRIGLCRHLGGPKWEANCLFYAREWRRRVLARLTGPFQPSLDLMGGAA